MKTLSAAFQTALGTPPFHGAVCMQAKYLDGTIIAGTEHSEPLPIDIGDGEGTLTYEPGLAFARTALEVTNNFIPPNMNIEGAFTPTGITVGDLRARKLEGAIIKAFVVDWSDLTRGIAPLGAFLPGEVKVGSGFEIELRGLSDLFSHDIVNIATGPCHLALGETVQCRVQLQPPAWSTPLSPILRASNDAQDFGAVNIVRPTTFNDRYFICTVAGAVGGSEPTWVTTLGLTTTDGGVTWQAVRALTLPVTIATIVSQREFTVTYAGDAPDELLRDGLARFTGASANSGNIREIKNWTLSSNTVKCFRGFPETIAVSDTLDLVAGCAKDVTDCNDDFDNIFNFGGHPNQPSVWVIIQRP
jgi:hypothetical protein